MGIFCRSAFDDSTRYNGGSIDGPLKPLGNIFDLNPLTDLYCEAIIQAIGAFLANQLPLRHFAKGRTK